MKEAPFDPTNREMFDALKSIRGFNALSDEQLEEVMFLCKVRKYDAGEVLITEGEYDQWIFFLVKGCVRIESGGVEIARLRQRGEVFGEMGIIDANPRSATITACESALCLAVDGSFMDRFEGDDQVMAQAIFFRIFAELLAERLRVMDERVRELEERLATGKRRA